MIDVMAALPAGSLLRRRQPRGDEWDTLRVLGHAHFAEGEIEPVVQTLAFGPPMHVAIESLDESYEIVREGQWPPQEWSTSYEEVLTRTDATVNDPGGAARVMQDARETPDEEPGLAVQAWRKHQQTQTTPQEDETHGEDR